MFETFFRWFITIGIDDGTAVWLARYGGIALAILATVIMYFVARRLLLSWITTLSKRTETGWDDAFLHNRVFARTAALLPLFVVYYLTPIALEGPLYAAWVILINQLLQILFAIQIVLILDGLLGSSREIAHQYESTRNLPVDSVVQLLRIVLYFFGGIVVISYLMGQTPVYLLSGLGAVTAVLSFVYQDALRGLVAGVQLTANNMLAKGDVIEMPSYGVSGSVMEVGLTTVKVQNFDYSITTVPTYALITDSFKNWRGMYEAAGRRIVRTILIDVTTVKFCEPALLDQLEQITILGPLLAEKQAEIKEHNDALAPEQNNPINGRRLTNLGLFRAYLTRYLQQHPCIKQDMSLMIRQLEAGTEGVGLQVYAFSSEKAWDAYEGVMADLFDHIIAVTPYFDLKVYQAPAGSDIQALKS